MSEAPNRRQILKTMAAAALIPPGTPLTAVGRPVKLTLTSITPHTVRLTIQTIESGIPLSVPKDGALSPQQTTWPKPTFKAAAKSVVQPT